DRVREHIQGVSEFVVSEAIISRLHRRLTTGDGLHPAWQCRLAPLDFSPCYTIDVLSDDDAAERQLQDYIKNDNTKPDWRGVCFHGGLGTEQANFDRLVCPLRIHDHRLGRLNFYQLIFDLLLRVQ